MRTSPAAVRWVPRGSIAIVGQHHPRIGGIEAHTPLGDQAHRPRQEAVFDAVNTLFDIGNGVRIRKLQRLLKDDGAGIDALVDEMDGHPGDLHAVLDRLLDRTQAGKGGQQRRMNVDDPPGEAANEGPAQQLHPAGEHDKLNAAPLEPIRERRVPRLAAGECVAGEYPRLDAGSLGPLECSGVGPLGRHAGDLDLVTVHAVDQRLQVGPGSGDEDGDPKRLGHLMALDAGEVGAGVGRQAQHGVRAARRLEAALLDQLIDPGEYVGAPHS